MDIDIKADMTDVNAGSDQILSSKAILAIMACFSLMQGLPAFFFTLGLPAILRDRGASLDVVGLSYVVWLPLVFKWLWAPLFDKKSIAPFGSRRNWLRALSILLGGAFSVVAIFPPEGSAWPLLTLSLVCAAIGATIQIVLASLLIENATPPQRALANSAGVAAMVLGGIIGAWLILELNEQFSWVISVFSVSAGILLLSAPVWFLRWGAYSTGDQTERTGFHPMAVFRRFFNKPNIGLMLVAILCFGATGGADALIPAILVDKGYSPAAAGWLLGTVATASIIPATGVVGFALRKFNVLTVTVAVYGLKAIVLAGLALSISLSPELVAVLSVADFCLSGALTVVVWQLYMGFSSKEYSATDYSVTTSLDAGMRFFGGIAAGSLGQQFGYSFIFTAAAVTALGACLVCLFLRRSFRLIGQEP
ncbi:MFS transporter [Brucella pseudogrignonensis]|uniref:MFS transporter n=1 Tax=Brucella pseudogrignonensis TaxID=419475 RepID=UPI0038B5D6C4